MKKRRQRSHITKRFQAHTTNATRARGRLELRPEPRPHTGPVREIARVVRRHRALPKLEHPKLICLIHSRKRGISQYPRFVLCFHFRFAKTEDCANQTVLLIAYLLKVALLIASVPEL